MDETLVSSPMPSLASPYTASNTSIQSKPSPTRLVVASEQTLLLEGLASLCAAIQHFEVVGKAGSGQEALDQLEHLKPEVALLDLELTDMLALEVIKRAVAARIPTRCAVFSARKDRKT